MQISKINSFNFTQNYSATTKPQAQNKYQPLPTGINGAFLLSSQISFGINKDRYTPEEIEFLNFRRNFSKELHKKNTAYGNSGWDFYINSTEENQQKFEKNQAEFNQLYRNQEHYKFLKSLNKKGLSRKDLQKQLSDFYNNFKTECKLSKQIDAMQNKENDISAKYNSYKYIIDGEEKSFTEISEIERTSKDENLRKKIHLAQVQAGDLIADDLVDLVKMRNKFAKSEGYNNYFEYILKESYEVDPDELVIMFDKLSEDAGKIYKKDCDEEAEKLKEIFNTDKLMLWHGGLLTDDNPSKEINKYIPDKETMVTLGKDIYKKMGWDIDEMPILLDLFPRANKNTHGFCFDIDTNKDVRIMANLDKNLDDFETLCHELGHAVYGIGISEKMPYINRCCASSAMTEAVAMMMQDIFLKENILHDALGVPQELIDKAKNRQIIEMASYARSYAGYLKFEKSLYENPDQDVKKLWKEVKNHYNGTQLERDEDNLWATIPHFISHPGYLQNYLRADIMAKQLYAAAVKDLGPLTENTDTAEYFRKKLFASGAKYSEDETLERFTGSKFSIDAYADMLKN